MSPYEPRLVKKLQPPITELISTTPAISLLYECVHTCIIGGMLQGPSGNSLAKTCVSKLAAFIQDPDQNCE
jgi:AP-3 complex subunit delta-1